MWGQGALVIDDSPPPEEEQGMEPPVDAPPVRKVCSRCTKEMNRLENDMQPNLGGMCDAFSINLPFTLKDKKRIVKNLNKINEEHDADDDEGLNFTRAVLMYMLKELNDVFGNQDTFVGEESQAAAIKEGTQGVNADEEGLARGKRQRGLPCCSS